MGYAEQVTRAEYWWDSEHIPISRSEWEAVAHSHPDLEVEGHVEWTDISQQTLFGIKNETISFSWRGGKVDIEGLFTERTPLQRSSRWH